MALQITKEPVVQCGGREQRVIGSEIRAVWMIRGARNMAGEAVEWFDATLEPLRGPCVEQQEVRIAVGGGNRFHVEARVRLPMRDKRGGAAHLVTTARRSALGRPLRPAAIEDGNITVSRVAQHPPQ